MRGRFVLWCGFVLVAMTAVSVWAGLESNVFVGFQRVWADHWGVATLADAHFGFTWSWLWICVQEPSRLARSRLRPGEGVEGLLLRKRP